MNPARTPSTRRGARLKRKLSAASIAGLIAATVLLPATTAAGVTDAATVDDPATHALVTKATARLTAEQAGPITLKYNRDEWAPLVIKLANAHEYQAQDGSQAAELAVDGNVYTHLDPSQLARAAKAGNTEARWYSSPADDTDTLNLGAYTETYQMAVKHGTVTHNGGRRYTVRADFAELLLDENATDDHAAIASSGVIAGTYRVLLDRKGNVARIRATETLPGIPDPYMISWTARYVRGPVTLKAPDQETVLTMQEVDGLPKLSALEAAAYETAQLATWLSEASSEVPGVDVVEEAAQSVATPEGLVATYTATGLRYTLGGEAMCVEAAPGTRVIVARVCPVA